MGRFIDLTGKVFGRWTVLGQDGRRPDGRIMWLCKCECGKQGRVSTSDLKAGKSVSCGCFAKDFPHAKTHGMTNTRLYNSWRGMRERCYNKKHEAYHRYGGRGIIIMFTCFEDFADWALKNGYEEGLTIDKIDNDGPYSRDNCQWLTLSENSSKRGKIWP